jgi:hypothetical protein
MSISSTQFNATDSEKSYDWLLTYADLEGVLRELVPRDSRILMVGCGNSTLSPDMVSLHNQARSNEVAVVLVSAGQC